MTLQELFAKDGSWCQGAYARDTDGNNLTVSLTYRGPIEIPKKAISWCLLGGLSLCYGVRSDAYYSARRKLEMVIGTTRIPSWNDRIGRTINDVRNAVKEANV
jgi:hypothetical protein